MNGALWISFVGAKAIYCMAPGPAVMLVMAHGLTPGGRSQWAAMGIIAVNAAYFVLAATGLGAVLVYSPEAFTIIKWLAAGYLVYAGARMFLTAGATQSSAERVVRSGWRACWVGILLQLANPNALLFFVAILPQFVDPQRPLLLQIGILGTTGLLLDCLVLTVYGAFASRFREFASSESIRLLASRLAGLLLMSTAVYTAMRS